MASIPGFFIILFFFAKSSMVLGGEGNKHPHRPLTGTRMCTSGRKTQKYQRRCFVAPEGGTSPAV